jgi:hypothetical protein
VHPLEPALHQLGQPGGLAQVLVELEVFQDEVEAANRLRRILTGLEAHGVVLHLGHPGGVLGLGLGEEERLEPSNVGVALAAGQ